MAKLRLAGVAQHIGGLMTVAVPGGATPRRVPVDVFVIYDDRLEEGVVDDGVVVLREAVARNLAVQQPELVAGWLSDSLGRRENPIKPPQVVSGVTKYVCYPPPPEFPVQLDMVTTVGPDPQWRLVETAEIGAIAQGHSALGWFWRQEQAAETRGLTKRAKIKGVRITFRLGEFVYELVLDPKTHLVVASQGFDPPLHTGRHLPPLGAPAG